MRDGKLNLGLGKNLPLLIITLLFGYDLLTYLPEEFSIVTAKIIYYLIIIILYAIYFFTFQKDGKILFNGKDISFKLTAVFCIMYLFRVFYDLYIDDIYHAIFTNKFTYIFLFLNSVIIPLFALRIIDYSKVNFSKLYTFFLILILICLIISFRSVIIKGLIEPVGGRNSANNTLDTIAYGHLGITLFLLGFTFFINTDRPKIKIINSIVMLFGLFSAGIANSRSPIVSLLVCILFYAFTVKRYKILVFTSIIISILFVYIDKVDTFFQSYGSSFVSRIIFTISNSSTTDVTSQRSKIYNIGLDILSNNLFLGDSFILQKSDYRGYYVHNFVLEAFISLGIIGGGLFLIFITIGIINAYRLSKINKKYLFISLIFIQYFVYSLFSRSIISLPIFWLSLFLVNSIYVFEKKA